MAKLTPIEKLDAALQDILSEYAGDVDAIVRDAVPKAAKKGAQTLRQTSPRSKRNVDKHYADSWKVKTSDERLSASAIIYNEKPHLPHLLEHGHMTRNGGRTAPIVHIKPVEESLAAAFEDEIKVRI